MTIDERIAECDRLELGQRAEGIGLRTAKLGQACFTYTRDPYLQQRFEQGWQDGLHLVAIDRGARASRGS